MLWDRNMAVQLIRKTYCYAAVMVWRRTSETKMCFTVECRQASTAKDSYLAYTKLKKKKRGVPGIGGTSL